MTSAPNGEKNVRTLSSSVNQDPENNVKQQQLPNHSVIRNASERPFISTPKFVNRSIDVEDSTVSNIDFSNFSSEKVTYWQQGDSDANLVGFEESSIPVTVQNCCESAQPQIALKSRPFHSEDERDVSESDHDSHLPLLKLAPDTKDMTNKCYMCFKHFRYKKNLYAHVRKIHSTQPLIDGGIICPLCKMRALRQDHLRSHLQALHGIKISTIQRHFHTMEDFNEWKTSIEEETSTLYVRRSSPKLLALNETIHYYKCHRSGSYVCEKGSRKRRKKERGTMKIGSTCPAAMQIIENQSGISLTFWSTHVGHHVNETIKPVSGHVENSKDKDTTQQIAESGADRLTLEDSANSKSDLTPDDLTVRQSQEENVKLPKKKRLLKPVSQATAVEKAEQLYLFLKSNEVSAEFRPQLCTMIDNVLSIVKRRCAFTGSTYPEKDAKKIED